MKGEMFPVVMAQAGQTAELLAHQNSWTKCQEELSLFVVMQERIELNHQI